ncbi:hypothetical protein ACM66B_001872 [Microbotryomycetes sp. NB124-2]
MADSEHGSASDVEGERSPTSARTFIAYSRMTLLSLSKSPLVPTKPEGMRELSEWYGEYTGQPASPPTKQRDLHHHHHQQGRNTHSQHGQATSPSSHSASRSNPFTNFGRFGVDGGLEGTGAIGSAGKFASLAGLGSGNGLDKRSSRDGSGAMDGHARSGQGRAYTESGKPGTAYFTNERDRSERMKGKQDGALTGGRRDENVAGAKQRGERRAQDDGGWRSVGGTNDRRGQRADASSARESRRDDRREERSGGNTRSNRPAWMDDDAPKHGAEPAWMDEPTTGMMSFESRGGADAPAATDGMDSIQAWKKQMREMEGKATSSANKASQQTEVPSSQPKASVFATLINKGEASGSDNHAATSSDEPRVPAPEAKAVEGGRGSRFARFFDGKPSSQPASSPQPSSHDATPASKFFDSMLAKSSKSPAPQTASPGPSKEDAESMSRLLGMLQMSGARAASPSESRSNAVASPPPPKPAAAQSTTEERKSSRFGFSQSLPIQDAQHKSSPPVQSFTESLQSFGLPTLGQNVVPGLKQQHAESHSSHSRTSSSHLPHNHHSSHGPGSGVQGSNSNMGHAGQPPPPPLPPMTSPLPMPNGAHAPLLSPMSAASHPLPPPPGGLSPRDMMPPHSMPGSASHPLPPLPPNSRPMGMPPFSGPLPPGELPAHLRQLLPSPPPGGFPPQGPQQQAGHDGNGRQHPPMMPGGPMPPQFMMYPPPPQHQFGGSMPPNFRGPPMQPPTMANVPFNAQGLPDLMALLNSGGAASSRLPLPSQQPQPRQ